MDTQNFEVVALPRDLLRQADAARETGLSRQLVAKFVRDGRLRSYTPANLVSVAELRAVEKRKSGRRAKSLEIN